VSGFRVQGLAVSEDARLIWVTATAPGRQGVVLRVPSFGAGPVTRSLVDHAEDGGQNGAVAQGADIFKNQLQPEQGLGPLFNGRACNDCHNTIAGSYGLVPFPGGMGVSADSFVFRVAHIDNGNFDTLLGRGGPIARQSSIDELGVPCRLPTGTPPQANAVSKRSAMTLRGTSLLDNIRVADLEQVRQSQPLAVQGRLNRLADGRVGRFGWKAQTATLVEFMGEAFRDEIGLTNPLAPTDLVNGCGASTLPIVPPEADAVPLTSIIAFLNTIDPPLPTDMCLSSSGAAIFAEEPSGGIGCATCHRPTMFGPGNSGTNPRPSDPIQTCCFTIWDPVWRMASRKGQRQAASFGSTALPPRWPRWLDQRRDQRPWGAGRGRCRSIPRVDGDRPESPARVPGLHLEEMWGQTPNSLLYPRADQLASMCAFPHV
jgi:hypothetical protein